jgi:hypothetical protein
VKKRMSNRWQPAAVRLCTMHYARPRYLILPEELGRAMREYNNDVYYDAKACRVTRTEIGNGMTIIN